MAAFEQAVILGPCWTWRASDQKRAKPEANRDANAIAGRTGRRFEQAVKNQFWYLQES